MDANMDSARDDLAYMRSLVGGTERMQKTIGEAFFWAGLLYGGQCLLHWLQTLGLLPSEGLIALAIVAVPTIIFVGFLVVIVMKDAKAPPSGPASRALGAVFQGAGIANLAMAFVFGYGSAVYEAPGLWLYHPVVVCMFQGVAWYVAFNVLRKRWLGFVAAGWFATTIALGMLMSNTSAFVLVLAIALSVLMMIPGWIIWRGVAKA
ncbi:MAG: hypothetical protein DCF16_06780 [Alphaproteobacteria bacterium]|nr:MAG: hypothetical protein DCF16_06780 [Alphaproteobacteria bacterium]